MSRYALALFGFVAVCSLAPSQDAKQAAPPQNDIAAGRVDLAILGGRKPLHVRVVMSLDEQPVTERWRQHLKRWFDFLNRDGDNFLSEDELLLAPVPVALLHGMRQGNIVYATGLGIPGGNFTHRKAAFAEFAAYYRNNGAGPVSIAAMRNPRDPNSNALLKVLDTNRDGKLARDELDAAPKSLAALDIDDDELIAKGELASQNFGGFGSVTAVAMNPVRPTGSAEDFIVLAGPSNLQKILKRHDKDGDGVLSPEEFPVEAAQFARIDVNGDGKIDAEELKMWAELPPDAEWNAAWTPQGNRMNAAVNSKSPDQRLVAGGLDVQFAANPRYKSPTSPSRYLMQLFKVADAKNAGSLTLDELAAPASQELKLMFPLLDRDRNGRITEAEVQQFIDLQDSGLSCHVTLTFVDQGRELFRAIDADNDGRLSQRELRSAWKRLSVFDTTGSGKVGIDDIGKQCSIVADQNVNFATARPTPFGMAAESRPANYPPGTPNWFIKMDINGDGEISRREFLGPTAEFRRLDADNDGGISPAEATREKK